MESDPTEQVDHILQKVHPPETLHHQPSPQWRDKGRSERQVIRKFLLGITPIVEKFEVFQMPKQSNEVRYLPSGSYRCS